MGAERRGKLPQPFQSRRRSSSPSPAWLVWALSPTGRSYAGFKTLRPCETVTTIAPRGPLVRRGVFFNSPSFGHPTVSCAICFLTCPVNGPYRGTAARVPGTHPFDGTALASRKPNPILGMRRGGDLPLIWLCREHQQRNRFWDRIQISSPRSLSGGRRVVIAAIEPGEPHVRQERHVATSTC